MVWESSAECFQSAVCVACRVQCAMWQGAVGCLWDICWDRVQALLDRPGGYMELVSSPTVGKESGPAGL